jgi:GT2 family glycosyltransferase
VKRTFFPASDHDAAVPSPHAHTISCIVAAYNAADTIGETLDSVHAQTVPADEIVVCDDGSRDTTAEIAGRYPTVRLLRQTNAGQAAALNRLVAAATSEWIMIVDADDWIHEDRVARIAEVIEEADPGVAIVTTDAWMVDQTGTTDRYYETARWVEQPQQHTEILTNNFVFGAAAVRRSAWLEVGGMHEALRVAQDYDLWVRIIRAGYGAALIDEPLYYYRRHHEASTFDNRNVLRANMTVLARILERTDLTAAERKQVKQATRSNLCYLRWLELAAGAREQGRPQRADLLRLAASTPFTRAGVKALAAAAISPRLWGRTLSASTRTPQASVGPSPPR